MNISAGISLSDLRLICYVWVNTKSTHKKDNSWRCLYSVSDKCRIKLLGHPVHLPPRFGSDDGVGAFSDAQRTQRTQTASLMDVSQLSSDQAAISHA